MLVIQNNYYLHIGKKKKKLLRLHLRFIKFDIILTNALKGSHTYFDV